MQRLTFPFQYTFDVISGSWQYRKKTNEVLSHIGDIDITPDGIKGVDIMHHGSTVAKTMDQMYFQVIPHCSI